MPPTIEAGSEKVTIAILGDRLNSALEKLDSIDCKMDAVSDRSLVSDVRIQGLTERIDKMERRIETISNRSNWLDGIGLILITLAGWLGIRQ